MLWRTCVVFAGLGTLFVCCGVGYEIWQEKNYHYTTYEFKGAIKSIISLIVMNIVFIMLIQTVILLKV